jgi:hypothetical protein
VIIIAARASVLPKKQPPHRAEEPAPPLEDRIRYRAFELDLQRVGQAGSEIEDWLQAEAEMTATAYAN